MELASLTAGPSLGVLREMEEELGVGDYSDSALGVVESGALLTLGVGHVWAVVRANFTGPGGGEDDAGLRERLSLGEARVVPRASALHSLQAAARIFRSGGGEGLEWDWWSLRVVWLWQSLLREPAGELREWAEGLWARLRPRLPALSPPLRLLLRLEIFLFQLTFLQVMDAQGTLDEAVEEAGFRVEAEGVLGKRTRFQVRDVAQLIVRGKRSGETPLALPNDRNDARLQDLALNDDTLLERIHYSSQVGEQSHLSGLEQALVLAQLRLETKTRPVDDDIGREEHRLALQLILDAPATWDLQAAALFLRTEREAVERRRVERGLAEAETLVKGWEGGLGLASSLFFAVAPPSAHALLTLHARLLLSLGVTREALKIFEELESWDEVIACYKLLEKPQQAEAVVRERMREKETPELLCVLGDLTNNPEHYKRAWDISLGASGRAQRSLGDVWLQRNDYETALQHFQTSLDIQPLNQGAWYSLGFCAMELKRWGEAAKAYHRCVCLDPDSGTAWNNLAAANIHAGHLRKAFTILQDALKYNMESWKVWENYAGVAAGLGEWEAVIRAFHRLLDLKDKYCDVKVLSGLVEACEESEALSTKARALLARMAAGGQLKGADALRLHALLLRPGGDAASLEDCRK